MIARSLTGGLVLAVALIAIAAGPTVAAPDAARPWMDPNLDPDARAHMVLHEMTLDEKLGLLHGPMAMPFGGAAIPKGAVGSAGYIPGVPRLGVPALQESDASLGVANPGDVRKDDGGTPLPSSLALASSFDPALAFDAGAMVGREAWSKGLNVLLGHGVDLARDPRNGRNFEYLGEDPLLAGTLAGEAARGTQSQHVVSTLKHYALNDQETLRQSLDVKISEAAARESDLLAFEIAVERGHPGSIMCAYNRVNGPWACDSAELLQETLKDDWRFPGWVMSDWGAVHATDSALRGLDQESGEQIDREVYFGAPLRKAVEDGKVPQKRIDDMARRILRSMFAVGLFDHPAKRTPIDRSASDAVAQREAEAGMVLLKNDRGVLPLASGTGRIVLIGGYADSGVLSGGGSAQVVPPEGPAVRVPVAGVGGLPGPWHAMVFHPSSPLKALQAAMPNAKVSFEDGAYPSAAAAAAKSADVAIVFATQWMIEGADVPDLTLPNGQDQLIEAVAAANPNTIVVLETGGPVLTPWLSKVAAVIEAWYPGERGGQALADILTGKADPSGRLPITFPASEAQLPRPQIPGLGLPAGSSVEVDYDIEGSDVGYRWFARTAAKPLFPFGYGLSYTRFAFSRLEVTGGRTLEVAFDLQNVGDRPGAEAAQVYLTSKAGQKTLRLIGFSKVALQPGETRRVTIQADPRVLADFDPAAHGWRIDKGAYEVVVGRFAGDEALLGAAELKARRFGP